MWLMTTCGCFSIVEKPWDRKQGTLTVRARVRADLVALKRHFSSPMKIRRDVRADYCYRAQVDRSAFARVLFAEVVGIGYANFKAEVTQRQGHERADVYMTVWRDLQALDRLNPPRFRQSKARPGLEF